MSYEIAVCWSILRSLIVGAACLWLGKKVQVTDNFLLRSKNEQSGTRDLSVPGPNDGQPQTPTAIGGLMPRRSRIPAPLVFIPFFVPGLVVGYAYRNASLSLVQLPQLNELLYLAIQISQLTPVVVLALRWLPAAEMSSTGQFLFGQVQLETKSRFWMSRLLAGDLPRQMTAFVIAALLCFQEVEIATLMQARGWPEWIFTKQAGGVELSEVWPYLVLPVSYGLALLVPVLGYWTYRISAQRSGASPTVSTRNAESACALPPNRLPWTVMSISWALVVIWPAISLAIGALRGRETIHLRTPIWREIGDALIQAGTVTLLVWGLAGIRIGGMLRAPFKTRLRPDCVREFPDRNLPSEGFEMCSREKLETKVPRFGFRISDIRYLLLIPGLLGSLALGLAVFEICQRIGVSPSYSPVPLVAAMVLFFLPRAVAMRAMLWRSEGQSNLFLAREMMEVPESSTTRSLDPSRADSSRVPVKNAGLASPLLPNSQPPSTDNPQRWSHQINWHLQGAGRFWAVALLFWWSYFELTLPSLLRPAGMAPAPMRLYNFLHYGHIPGLAAMLVVVLSVPLLLGVGLSWTIRRR